MTDKMDFIKRQIDKIEYILNNNFEKDARGFYHKKAMGKKIGILTETDRRYGSARYIVRKERLESVKRQIEEISEKIKKIEDENEQFELKHRKMTLEEEEGNLTSVIRIQASIDRAMKA